LTAQLGFRIGQLWGRGEFVYNAQPNRFRKFSNSPGRLDSTKTIRRRVNQLQALSLRPGSKLRTSQFERR
jgi:hypothetical protein